jgi:hypothetical protein
MINRRNKSLSGLLFSLVVHEKKQKQKNTGSGSFSGLDWLVHIRGALNEKKSLHVHFQVPNDSN